MTASPYLRSILGRIAEAEARLSRLEHRRTTRVLEHADYLNSLDLDDPNAVEEAIQATLRLSADTVDIDAAIDKAERDAALWRGF